MAPKSKGLGRGLDALLATSKTASVKDSDDAAVSDQQKQLQHLPIEYMQPGKYQPRKEMADDALEDLAASIRSQGIIQPIVVRALAENKFEIIAGERRWRAAQLAELSEVPCLIKDIPDDAAVAIALIENIQREDLNAMEEAQALERLMTEFELTHQQVAQAVGKSRTTVTNLLRLNGLEKQVKTLLEHGDIEMGHARALLAVEGDTQSELAKTVADKGLTVRQTEAMVKKAQAIPSENPAETKPELDPDVVRLQSRLEDTFGAQVQINHNAKGKGKLVINFADLEHLQGILTRMDIPQGE